tara:strand:- start:2266 stop:3255 length:990 start_codon:yes stop_codon:yes gene_type:complete
MIIGIYEFIQRSRKDTFSKMTKEKIRKYLSNPKNKRPFMWIHVPYEYNTRNWLNFMSRKTQHLNQPYLEMCLESIINHCDDTMNICIVDDSSFSDIIPDWEINMESLSSPTLEYVRQIALTKLVYLYGGMITPISFVCLKDMKELYLKGIKDNKMFVCENISKHLSSDFYPDSRFIGAEKENKTVLDLIRYMEQEISEDYTYEEKFIGKFDNWCSNAVKEGNANLIPGSGVGVKDANKEAIKLNDLLDSTYPINLCPCAYGVWIPMNELLKRVVYGWFLRMDKAQILSSDFSLSKIMMLSLVPPEQDKDHEDSNKIFDGTSKSTTEFFT